MVDLSTLTFKVNTDALVDAKNAIDALVVAQKALSGSGTNAGKGADAAEKGVENLGKGAERTAAQLKGMERVLERQATKMAILTGATVKLADGESNLERVFSAGQASMLASAKVAGATKGQFDQLAGSIQQLNSMVGANKFDDSASGLLKLKKEVDELGIVYNNTANGIKLTAKETRDLARDIAAHKVLMDNGKISAEQYGMAVHGITQSYVNFSQEKNQMIQQSKMAEDQIKREAQTQARAASTMMDSAVQMYRERQAAAKQAVDAEIAEEKRLAQFRKYVWADYAKNVGKDVQENSNAWREYFMQQGTLEKPGRASTKPIEQPMDSSMKLFYKEQAMQAKELAKAEKFLATEMQRVDAVLSELNHEHSQGTVLSEKHANSISRFANQLKAAGVSGTTATAQLEQYRGKMQQIEAIENRRAQNRLANALAPQISDVAVSIAGGMPLHLVIMQQGLQIRDLIGQSGVAADQLQKTMRDAMKNMVTSIAGTVAALGQMAGGALMDAGKSTIDFATKVTGTSSAVENLRYQLTLASMGGDELSKKTLAVGNALARLSTIIAATGIGVLVAGAIAAVVATVQLIREQSELSKALNTTSASLGMTVNSAYEYVAGIEGVEGKTRSAITALIEIGKAGNIPREAFEMIVQSAVAMESAAGVAISETVKNFDKLRDDPVKAVLELGVQTGYFSKEVIESIRQLQIQGDTLGAAKIAMDAYAAGTKDSADTIRNNYGTLERVAAGIKSAFNQMWDAVLGVGRPVGDLKELQANAATLRQRANQDPDNLFAEQQAEMAESSLRAAQALEKNAKAKAVNTENTLLLTQAERVRTANMTASQKYQQESNRLLELEQSLKAKNLLTERDAAAITAAKNKAYAEYMKSFEKKEDKKAKSEQGKQVTYEIGLYEKLNDAFVKIASSSQNYNDIQKALLDIFDDPRFANMTDPEKRGLVKHAEELLNAAAAGESLAEAEKAAAKAHEDYVKAQAEGIKQQEDSAKTAEERLAKMQEEAAALALAEELQISLAQAIEMTAIARLREQQAMEMNTGVGNPQTLAALEREIQARQKIIAEMGKKDSQEVAKGYADDLKKEFESMRDGIADSITTALFEGGKAGSQKIRQVIVNALREPISVFVTAIVNTLLGSILGGGGQGGGALSNLLGGGGSGGGLGSLQNLLSQGQSFLNGSYMTDSAIKYISNMGSQIGGDIGAKMVMNADIYGAVAGAVGNAFAGYGIGKALSGAISGGYSVGKGYNQFQEIGMAVASAMGGPVFGAIIGAATGAVNRLFGRKLKDSGIEGTFSGTDSFAGNTYEFHKGGVFRSDKTVRNALGSDVTDALGDAFKAVRDGILDMSGALGLGAEALDGYTKSIKFSTKGMNEQQIQEAWAEQFTAMSEEMAQRFMGTFETTTRGIFSRLLNVGRDSVASGPLGSVASGLLGAIGRSRTTTTWTPGEFVREGETALQALTRLSTAIKTVNPMLDVLGLSMYEVSLAGGDMASKLVDLFGNAETMLGLTTAYYQNYYSEAERTAEATKQMTTALAELGINTLPMSRGAYRDLVESQDLTTEAGRKMFAELMKLAPAFSELTSAMSEVTNGVIDEVRRLRGEIYGSSAATLEAQFAIATAAARAGDSNAMAQLPALSQALEETARLNAVTAADLAISRARLAASLTETLATQGTTIPAFASGGLYRGGLALVGERGPELINFNRGGRVHNNGETMQMLKASDRESATTMMVAAAMRQVGAIREVNTEINMMRAETKSTAINMAKLIRLLERVTRDGESLQVTNV